MCFLNLFLLLLPLFLPAPAKTERCLPYRPLSESGKSDRPFPQEDKSSKEPMLTSLVPPLWLSKQATDPVHLFHPRPVCGVCALTPNCF